MALSSSSTVTASPTIGTVGAQAALVLNAAPDGELRWYLIEAPITSSLLGDDTTARLTTNASGYGLLTPDQPGRYVVEARDVAVTVMLPSYDGEIVAAPSDDDEVLYDAGARYEIGQRVRYDGRSYRARVASVNSAPTEPAASPWAENRRPWSASTTYQVGDDAVLSSVVYRCVLGHTNQTPPNATYWRVVGVQVEYWCAQVVRRQIGDGPHTATLQVRTYDDRVVSSDDDPNAVVLLPGSSAAARLAVNAPDVVKVLDDIREIDQAFRTRMVGTVSASGRLMQYGAVATDYTARHLAEATTFQTHGGIDATNALVTSATPTTIGEAIAQLNDLRTKLIAHALVTTGSVHAASQTITGVGAACTDLATALVLAEELFGALLYGHMPSTASHGGSATRPGDGSGREHRELPTGLDDLLEFSGYLATTYESHRTRTSNLAAHAAVDTDNVLTVPNSGTPDGLIAFANAFADALERHAFNLDRNGQPAAVPYHSGVDYGCRIPYRAGDVASAVRLLEMISNAFHDHQLSNAHGARVRGAHGTSFGGIRGQRLTRAWMRAAGSPAVVVPDNLNESATQLLGGLGWTT